MYSKCPVPCLNLLYNGEAEEDGDSKRTAWRRRKLCDREWIHPPTGTRAEQGTAATWPWFDAMHGALGERPAIQPPLLVASCMALGQGHGSNITPASPATNSSSITTASSSPPTASSSPPTASRSPPTASSSPPTASSSVPTASSSSAPIASSSSSSSSAPIASSSSSAPIASSSNSRAPSPAAAAAALPSPAAAAELPSPAAEREEGSL
ncbi:hypothetical protein WMY93_008842 [Mugilogobius chulae]|uniref:Uncharacterized protein n=1 Tax=Mugilogobius chulae TaxID=88201 RepID=A0AAW0PDQ2_9GOBI